MSADFEARFERKMEYILDTLASVSAKNDETAEIVQRLGKRMDQAAVRQDKMERQLKGLQTLAKIGMRQIAKREIELAELRKYTDQRFTQVMERFDRWLDSRNGSNGHGPDNGRGKNGGKKRS